MKTVLRIIIWAFLLSFLTPSCCASLATAAGAFVVPPSSSSLPVLRQLHETPFGLVRFRMVSESAESSSSSSSSESSILCRHRRDDTTIPETSSLPPHTFSGLVEQALHERFGSHDVSRVVTSWRLLEKGYEHYEFVGGHQSPPITADETTSSACYQRAHSYVPNLTAKQFYNLADFEWTTKLQRQYKTIKSEFTRVTADMDKLSREGNNIWAGALTQDASSYGRGWKTLVLMDRGVWDPVNVNLFPKTSQAIVDSGVPIVEAFFASMEPQSDIKVHTDNTNFVVTAHLGLDIPDSGHNKCRLTIGDETRQWENGQMLMFDTSILHSAINESNETRYILMLRLWHPELSEVERQALQFTYDCLQLPELVSANPEERARAEEYRSTTMHAFPEIKRGTGTTTIGFGGGGGSGTKKRPDKKRKRRK